MYKYSLVLISIFIALICNSCGSSRVAATADYEIGCENKQLERCVDDWLGTPYKYGGNDKRGVDCSGLVQQVYKRVYGKGLYRNSQEIFNKNCRKISFNKLKEGDLVFFATSPSSNRISHVGIFLYDDKFVHASSSKGVVVSSLTNSYYVRTFKCAGRVK